MCMCGDTVIVVSVFIFCAILSTSMQNRRSSVNKAPKKVLFKIEWTLKLLQETQIINKYDFRSMNIKCIRKKNTNIYDSHLNWKFSVLYPFYSRTELSVKELRQPADLWPLSVNSHQFILTATIFST